MMPGSGAGEAALHAFIGGAAGAVVQGRPVAAADDVQCFADADLVGAYQPPVTQVGCLAFFHQSMQPLVSILQTFAQWRLAGKCSKTIGISTLPLFQQYLAALAGVLDQALQQGLLVCQ